jgi:hypothetical protein
MIRRESGSDWLLITQDDHARLAGELAGHVGNQLFDRPAPSAAFVQAVTLHDCGWPLHDNEPTLNAAGEPIDVFETTPHIGLKVWSASADRAAATDPRAGLLVSLHTLSLSIGAAGAKQFLAKNFDLNHPPTRFEMNKFQHRQVELQESLRRKLGLPTDLPLKHGLSIDSKSPAERELLFQFRLLQAMDQISLALCCNKPPVSEITPVQARPGGRTLSLRLRRTNDQTLQVSPWPFDLGELKLHIPHRRLAATAFSPDAEGEAEFRRAYNAATVEQFEVTIIPRR